MIERKSHHQLDSNITITKKKKIVNSSTLRRFVIVHDYETLLIQSLFIQLTMYNLNAKLDDLHTKSIYNNQVSIIKKMLVIGGRFTMPVT